MYPYFQLFLFYTITLVAMTSCAPQMEVLKKQAISGNSEACAHLATMFATEQSEDAARVLRQANNNCAADALLVLVADTALPDVMRIKAWKMLDTLNFKGHMSTLKGFLLNSDLSPSDRAMFIETCEKDADGDGINDYADLCPDEPEDWDSFDDEDGCPDYDNDRDGYYDSEDLCPNRAEDYDGVADYDGCPEEDYDLDGFPDSADVCPHFTGFSGTDGCPDHRIAPDSTIWTLYGVRFDTTGALANTKSYEALVRLADVLKNHTPEIPRAIFVYLPIRCMGQSIPLPGTAEIIHKFLNQYDVDPISIFTAGYSRTDILGATSRYETVVELVEAEITSDAKGRSSITFSYPYEQKRIAGAISSVRDKTMLIPSIIFDEHTGIVTETWVFPDLSSTSAVKYMDAVYFTYGPSSMNRTFVRVSSWHLKKSALMEFHRKLQYALEELQELSNHKQRLH